jgi:hypothetical protein
LEMYRKLFANVRECHQKNESWSATLLQIQKVYGIGEEVSLIEVGVQLSMATQAIVYFCFDLPDTDNLETDVTIEDFQFPLVKELTLYAVPPELLWIGDDECYRKAMANKLIEKKEFRTVYVCYRNREAVSESLPYTRFVELHVKN